MHNFCGWSDDGDIKYGYASFSVCFSMAGQSLCFLGSSHTSRFVDLRIITVYLLSNSIDLRSPGGIAIPFVYGLFKPFSINFLADIGLFAL